MLSVNPLYLGIYLPGQIWPLDLASGLLAKQKSLSYMLIKGLRHYQNYHWKESGRLADPEEREREREAIYASDSSRVPNMLHVK